MSKCIGVFVKYIPYLEMINEDDLSAIEAAKAVKELSNSPIRAFSIVNANDFNPNIAREIFSRGADEVFIYRTPELEQDIHTSALITKDIVEEHKCNIYIFGEMSSDTAFNCFHGYLASMLGITYIKNVTKVLEVSGDLIVAESFIFGGTSRIKAKFPVILSVSKESFPPNPVPIKIKLEARKKSPNIKEFSPESMTKINVKARLAGVRQPSYRKRLQKELSSLEEIIELLKSIGVRA